MGKTSSIENEMSAKERAVRVVASIVLIVFALLLLNHSFYSFWLAGGPPNEYPQSWYNQGIVSGNRAISLIIFGIAVQFSWEKLKKSWLFWLSIVLVLLGFVYPFIREQVLIDSCLDNGGSWQTIYFSCKY